MSDSQDANTTREPIKGSLNKKKLNLIQINRIRNTGKIVKRKRKPFKIKWKIKFMSKNKTTRKKNERFTRCHYWNKEESP